MSLEHSIKFKKELKENDLETLRKVLSLATDTVNRITVNGVLFKSVYIVVSNFRV